MEMAFTSTQNGDEGTEFKKKSLFLLSTVDHLLIPRRNGGYAPLYGAGSTLYYV